MIDDTLRSVLAEAVAKAAPDLGIDATDLPEPELSRPRAKEHGDWATNVALVLAPRVGWAPRQVAEAVVRYLHPDDLVDRIEVAGPGFINLFLKTTSLHDLLRQILREGETYGRAAQPTGQRLQVEFVSANPTGPLHVGTARNAAIGDSLANVLEFAGYGVEREYYFNDTNRQIDLFGESVEARYLQRYGVEAAIPEGGYHGDYVADLAEEIARDHGDALLNADPNERRRTITSETVARTIEQIRGTLERFRVRFDTFVNERTFHETGAIAGAVDRLRAAGLAYDAEGAVFFRATAFGDEKDRVLIRSTGAPTYFAADCAYMLDKASRGFDRFVYVWGADHHGDLKRMQGAADALGIGRDRLEFVLYQLVTLYRGGEVVRMSRRAGDFVTLDELIDEVGADAARYTLLTRSHDSPIDFDIVEVTRQSMENPVYYVQYAHARIASLLSVAREQGVERAPLDDVDLGVLEAEEELDLIRKLGELPEVVHGAAAAFAPHRLTRYAEQVAATFHRFYTVHRVITDDGGLTQARLGLAEATKQVVGTILRLIGVTAPESMERLDEQPA